MSVRFNTYLKWRSNYWQLFVSSLRNLAYLTWRVFAFDIYYRKVSQSIHKVSQRKNWVFASRYVAGYSTYSEALTS